jgi:hypothetical protein
MEWLAVVELLVPLARIYDRRHKTKYLKEVLNLRSEIENEQNKKTQGEMVNHARIDIMSSRVRSIMDLFRADFEKQNPIFEERSSVL